MEPVMSVMATDQHQSGPEQSSEEDQMIQQHQDLINRGIIVVLEGKTKKTKTHTHIQTHTQSISWSEVMWPTGASKRFIVWPRERNNRRLHVEDVCYISTDVPPHTWTRKQSPAAAVLSSVLSCCPQLRPVLGPLWFQQRSRCVTSSWGLGRKRRCDLWAAGNTFHHQVTAQHHTGKVKGRLLKASFKDLRQPIRVEAEGSFFNIYQLCVFFLKSTMTQDKTEKLTNCSRSSRSCDRS